MIAIPLGLNVQIYKIPWVTILLVIGILIVSFENFEVIDSFQVQYLRSKIQLDILKTKLSMLDTLCEKRQLDSEILCTAIHKSASSPIYSFMDPVKNIQKLLPAKKDVPLLGKFQEYLYSDSIYESNLEILQQGPAYQRWQELEAQYGQEVSGDFKERNILSKGNFNPIALLKAQFLHGGLAHLFGNLIFFIFLSIFVEMRMGSSLYAMVYLLAGVLGLSVQIFFMKDAWIPLMGASANIAGVAGAFVALFMKRNIRVLISTLVYNRIISLPVYFFFPVLMLAGDITGLLNPHGTNVAHLAHLAGFAVGFTVAFLFKKNDALPDSFFFREEFMLFKKSRKLETKEATKVCLGLLKMNPENNILHQSLLESFQKPSSWESLSSEQKKYIQNYLHHYIPVMRKDSSLLDLALRISSNWPLEKVLKPLSIRDFQFILDQAYQQGNLHCYSTFQKAALLLHPGLQNNFQWQMKIKDQLSLLEKKGSLHVQSA